MGRSRPPRRFVEREYMVVIYESDPAAVRAAVPAPLAPDPSNRVFLVWIRTPDAPGVGGYTGCGVAIPCSFNGRPCNFIAQTYLDGDAALAAGRGIRRYPRRYAHPRLVAAKDTLTGTLDYAGQRVAAATMASGHAGDAGALARTGQHLRKLHCALNIIPDIDGGPAVAQLMAIEPAEVAVRRSCTGPARFDLVPHVNVPVADLPVRRVVGGRYFVADLTLPAGRVLVDYLHDRDVRQAA